MWAFPSMALLGTEVRQPYGSLLLPSFQAKSVPKPFTFIYKYLINLIEAKYLLQLMPADNLFILPTGLMV
jgi:hypothetical protein